MALTRETARQLAVTTKTRAQWGDITPRWLLNFLPMVNVEAGTYRVNTVTTVSHISAEHSTGTELPSSFVDYNDKSPEYPLSVLQSNLRMHTQVLDVYNTPHNQLGEQVRLTIEAMREEEEYRFINSSLFGLLSNCAADMRVEASAVTPDSMDDLIGVIWKKPAFFLMSPATMAKFGRECTKRGVCIGTVEIFGAPFWTWRGIPIVPSDKVLTNAQGETSVLLMRVGEDNQGVVGLHKLGLPGQEVVPGLSVRLLSTDSAGVSHFVVTRYISLAVLVPDALGVMSIKP